MPVQYKQFRIGELFDISTGSLLKIKEVPEGNIPRISVRSDNNGILGYYDTDGNSDARHAENFISVNFFGNAFYHPYKASLEMKVHCLKLKDREFTEAIGLYLTSVLNKVFAQKHYSYGEQLSRSDLKKQDLQISLPVTPSGTPDWDYMQERIAELEQERIAELEQYLVATGLNDYELTDEDREVLSLSGFRRDEGSDSAAAAGLRKEMKSFLLRDIAILDYGNKFDKNKMTYKFPSVNFVSRTATNNGISDFVDVVEGTMPFSAGTITLAFGGSIGSCFLQEKPYYTGQNVGVIGLPDGVTTEAKVYFTEALSRVCKSKYVAFGDEINKHFKRDLTVPLPICTDAANNPVIDPAKTWHPDGYVPDWEFMSRYIRAIEKMVVRDVVKYKDEMVQKTKQVVGVA